MDPAGQRVTHTGTAGVIARPPLLFLAALLLGFVSDHLLPLPFLVPSVAHWISAILAGCLILVGIGIFTASIRSFSRASTPVPSNQPTRALGTTGTHAWN